MENPCYADAVISSHTGRVIILQITNFRCQKECSSCCGIQPVTKTQLERIQRALAAKSRHELHRMSRQKRDPQTCPLLDTENHKCFVYSARPEVCRMYGFYQGLECPHAPQYATGSLEEGTARLRSTDDAQEIVGVLGVTVTWEDGLREGVLAQ